MIADNKYYRQVRVVPKLYERLFRPFQAIVSAIV
jgi:hypothetical protein